MSTAGVVLTIVSSLTCFVVGFCLFLLPWFLIPLCFCFCLLREQHRHCRDCGRNVD